MKYLALLVVLFVVGTGCREKGTTPQVDNSPAARFPVPENSARRDGFSSDAEVSTPGRGGPTSRPGQNASTNPAYGGHPGNAVFYATNQGAVTKQTYPGPKDAPDR
jgi:hypothetical protein